MERINLNINEEDILFDHFPQGICRIELNKKITGWNKAMAEWISISSEQVIGKNLTKYLFSKF